MFPKLRKYLSNERYCRLGKEAAWICLGQCLTVVGALVGVRLITGLLTPTDYGELTLGMTIATLVQVVALGPLGNGAARFYATAHELGELSIYINDVRSLVIKTSGYIILLGSIIVSLCILVNSEFQIILFGVVSLFYALALGYNSILNGLQNAARQRAIVALHQGLITWGRFLIAAGLMIWIESNSIVAMTGYGLAMMFVLISQYYFFSKIISNSFNDKSDKQHDTKWGNRIISYSWPFATWGVIGWINLAADRWAIQIFSSTYEVGLYAVLFQLGYYPMNLLANAGSQLISPIYFKRVGDASDFSKMLKVYALGWKVAIFFCLLFLGVSIFFAFFHKQIFSLLVAPEYKNVSCLLPWFSLASGFMSSAHFFSIVLQANLSTNQLIFPKNISNCLGVLFVVIGALHFGMLGVVGGKLLGSIIYFMWMMFLYAKNQRDLELANTKKL